MDPSSLVEVIGFELKDDVCVTEVDEGRVNIPVDSRPTCSMASNFSATLQNLSVNCFWLSGSRRRDDVSAFCHKKLFFNIFKTSRDIDDMKYMTSSL